MYVGMSLLGPCVEAQSLDSVAGGFRLEGEGGKLALDGGLRVS